MNSLRILGAALAASLSFGVAGCVTDDYGYGYSGVSLGYGSGYYGSPSWGWYDDYYYPGTGYYIYDRGGRRHSWNDRQRGYWEGRRGNRDARENWSGYRRGGTVTNPAWQQRREAWRAQRQEQGVADQSWAQRREAWRAQRQPQGATSESRAQRREAWRAERQSQPQGTANGARGRSWRRGN